jgi:drug/metabolite transporter (DMT)-like permease
MSSSTVFLGDETTRLRAIGLMCCAIGCFALLDAAAKYLVTVVALPVFQVVWFRCMSHVLFNIAAFGPRTMARSFKSARPLLQILRGVLLFVTTALSVAGLRFVQLDQAATVFFLSPFIIAMLAGPFLGEWIGWRRLVAILVGFSGVILVVRPGFGGVPPAIIYSFCATFCYACYNVLTRYLARYDPTLVTQLYTPLAGFVLLAPVAWWIWVWPAEPWFWLIIFSTGISGGLGHYLLILAHRQAPAPILAPFTYIGLMFQSLVGFLVFADVPSPWTVAGGAVIVGSGLYLMYREHRAGRAASRAAASLPG